MNIYNHPTTKEKRRSLRDNQTDAEKVLWNILRNKQMGGYKFFRQYGIGCYIVDFYCPMLKMVVEADGGQHFSEEGIKYDHQREEFLKKMGIKVIRFNNLDVLKNREGIFEYIQKELPLTPSLKKEGELSRLSNNKGSSLLLTFIFLTVLLTLALTIIETGRWNNKNAIGQIQNAQAFYLAQAGINQALYYLQNTAPDGSVNGTWRTTTSYSVGATGSVYSSCTAGVGNCVAKKESLGAGTYTMWVQSSGNYITITSQGVINGVSRIQQEQVTQPGNLVGYWKFDDTSSGTALTTAIDSSGWGNTGTLVGSPTWTTGNVGSGALSFNGTSQYVQVGSVSTFDFGSSISFTLSAWVKTSSSGQQRIISTGHFGWTNGFFLKASNADSGTDVASVEAGIGAGTVQSSSIAFSGTVTTNDGNWHHIVVTFDQTNYVAKIYVDGIQSGIVKVTGTCGSVSGSNLNYSGCNINANHSVNTTIAAYATGVEYLNGLADDVRIYNRTLTATEVQDLYNNSGPLVGWWKLQDGTATTSSTPTTAVDSSGNSYTGTLGSPAPTWTTAYVNGSVNGALSFSGASGSNVAIASALGTALTGKNTNMTVSSWFYRSALGNHGALYKIGNDTDALGGDGFAIGIGGIAYENSGDNILALYEGARWIPTGVTVGTGWNHLVLVINSSGYPNVYLNGASIYSDSSTPAMKPIGSIDGTFVDDIGGYTGYGPLNRYFNGAIEDVRVYNTALTAGEVSNLYTYGTTYSPTLDSGSAYPLAGSWQSK